MRYKNGLYQLTNEECILTYKGDQTKIVQLIDMVEHPKDIMKYSCNMIKVCLGLNEQQDCVNNFSKQALEL